ncbi:MAG: hypothetical protein ACLFSY_03660 [Desulfonatronovibrionaceae bacterium]
MLDTKQDTGGGESPPVSLKKRWARLLLVVLILAAFIHFAPLVERLPWVGWQVTLLRESGTNVGAWYYDNVEEYFEAEEYMRYLKQKRARKSRAQPEPEEL